VRFEANGGPEPSVEELRALNLQTLTQQPTRLAFLASCDHRVVLKCVLSPISECQALVSLVLQSILGHPSYEPFPAGGPLEKKRTNITYDLGCQCGAVEERIAVSAEYEQIREKHGEPLSTMLQNMTLSDLAPRLAETHTGLGPVLEAKLQEKGAPVVETTASLLAMHPALASDERAVRDILFSLLDKSFVALPATADKCTLKLLKRVARAYGFNVKFAGDFRTVPMIHQEVLRLIGLCMTSSLQLSFCTAWRALACSLLRGWQLPHAGAWTRTTRSN
jgi:hypothetical protein